jgi:peptide/nickel transport system substrate-binding protein
VRKTRRLPVRLVALAAALALIVGACGGDDDNDSGGSNNTNSNGEAPQGGTLIIGAEQQPDCMAWIKSCAGASWGTWTVAVQTMPRAFDTVSTGQDTWGSVYNKDLLTGEPSVDNTNPDKPVITYKINPAAQWSDQTPITCDDFQFSWDAVVNGKDIYDPTGYVDVESVDCPDPKTAVLNFKQPYSGWKGLFGALYGLFPKHLLDGKDIQAEMGNGYTWSGGPWKLEKWENGVEIVLIPNENFWAAKPKLDKVIFKVQADTATEFRTFQNNEVAMIYPQPQPDAVDQIKQGIPGAQSAYTAITANNEALWMNNGVFPLDDLNVRKAIAYAIDRNALIEQLFGPLGVDAPMQTLNPPILAAFSDTEAWAEYTQDLDQVNTLMTESGWAKNGDGIWAKDGKTASITYKTTSGNARRELTGQILQSQLKDAGFDMKIDNQVSSDLFGDQLPKGDFHIAVYAQVLTAVTVGQCSLFCSKNIPDAANEFSGQNWTRTNVPELDPILEQLDRELDETEQANLGKQADKIQAENMVSLPFDPLPNILIWNDTVKGAVSDNPVLGPFWNLNTLGVQS